MSFVDLILRPLAARRRTVKYPRAGADAVSSARVPSFAGELCEDHEACVRVCPVDAIVIEPRSTGRLWSLDYGRCIFCAECIRACPSGAIRGTGEFELGTRSREGAVRSFQVKDSRDE